MRVVRISKEYMKRGNKLYLIGVVMVCIVCYSMVYLLTILYLTITTHIPLSHHTHATLIIPLSSIIHNHTYNTSFPIPTSYPHLFPPLIIYPMLSSLYLMSLSLHISTSYHLSSLLLFFTYSPFIICLLLSSVSSSPLLFSSFFYLFSIYAFTVIAFY
ncbi:hypothetical protein NEPAR06_2172 [Nematocida parisii]|nr:hypothetical protein NEPAR07_1549 [Nematocida parisii]KAI5156365.1 hypothetical protein NEPAR06_2172 [Nematocida parisii]KAI5157767.1 hypothetical protein NEPAR05_1569 [Nematocida parisii]